MKKNIIIGIAMAVGMLSFGALSASAAVSHSNVAACQGKQPVQQINQETAGLARQLEAKEIELQEQNGYREWDGYHEGIDVGKINKLEAEVCVLKNKINSSAQKTNVTACNCS